MLLRLLLVHLLLVLARLSRRRIYTRCLHCSWQLLLTPALWCLQLAPVLLQALKRRCHTGHDLHVQGGSNAACL